MKWNHITLIAGVIAMAFLLLTYQFAQAEPDEAPMPNDDAQVDNWQEYDADQPLFVRTYDIRQLTIFPVNYGSAPHGHVGQYSGPVLINAMTDEPVTIDIHELARYEYIDQIIQMIEDQVGDPNEWLDEFSKVSEYRGTLVISTSNANHESIKALLNELAANQQCMISTDATVLRLPANSTSQILNHLGITGQYLSSGDADRLMAAAVDDDQIEVVATGRQVLMNGQRAYVATQDFIKPPRPVNGNDEYEFIDQINAADDPWTHVFVSDIQAIAAGDASSIHLYARHTLALPNKSDKDRITRHAWRSNLTIKPGDAVLQSAALITAEDGQVDDYLLLLRVNIAAGDD